MTETPEDIPQANQLLYSMKLSSGEELMCTVIDMMEEGVHIESPVKVAIVPLLDEEGMFLNRLHTSAWMPFSSSRIFYIDFKDILTMSPLHEKSQKLYTRLVNQYEGYEDEPVLPDTNSFFIDSSESVQ